MGPVRRARRSRRRELERLPRRRAVRRQRAAPPSTRRRSRCPAELLDAPTQAAHVDAGGLRPDPERARRAERRALARRASSRRRPMSPCRPISAPGSTGAACSRARRWPTLFKTRAHSLDLQLGVRRRRASISSSASPRTTCSSMLVGARPVALALRRAPAADRHALRSVHQRGLDALNYACYQDARFMLVATPSGVTLAPEGGAHQSIAHAADRHGAGRARRLRAGLCRRARGDHALRLRLYAARRRGCSRRAHWLRDETGGSVYLRLSTRPLEQPQPRR